MIQHIVIGLLFMLAVAYLVRIIYRSLAAKSACASGCNKCSAIDFAALEKKIAASAPLKKN